MKFITLRVPKPFDIGPQYDENGNLEPGSWPAGLPHEGIEGWTKISGESNQGLSLCEFMAADDWPLEDLPGGWRANAAYAWDLVSQVEYDEDGNPINSPYVVEKHTDQSEYMSYFPDDTEYHRHHTYLGWPPILT